MNQVAALFVEKAGAYSNLPQVDPWTEDRDARTYTGSLPVVAHPPCHLWGKMANVNFARYGGEHNRPGNDLGMFRSALENVLRCGGVLEHPKASYAWAEHGLSKPVKGAGWQFTLEGLWVCEVWQSAYGHPANKATWLVYLGKVSLFSFRWGRPEGEFQVG